MVQNEMGYGGAAWDFATPLPIMGVYNNYGGIDKVKENLISQLTLEYLRANMADPLTEEEKLHLSCYATNQGKTEEDLSYLVSACSQEFFKFRFSDLGEWREAVPEVVFVREDVYRLTQGFSWYWGKSHDYLERAWHFFEKAQGLLDSEVPSGELAELTDSLWDLVQTQAKLFAPIRIVTQSKRKLTDEEKSQVYGEIRKQCDFLDGLSRLRRELSPKTGHGLSSQETEYDEHALFHEKLAEFAKDLHEQEKAQREEA